MKLSHGSHLGHYEILSPLGAGGMGEVYRARDLNLERDVAIKVLPELTSGEADALHRFEREVRAIAALNHPNILIIHDYGDHEGCRYAVTELLEGETLDSRLARKQKLPWKDALALSLELARGLAAAHEKGVIHRDIKPSNLFLTNRGAAKILDFGLARSNDPALTETIEPGRTIPLRTLPGTVMGTVGYMSPEQARGEPTDPRTDIFSFGCVLYEMLSGHRPFQRQTAADTIAAILNAEPPELSRFVDDVPRPLADIVARCLNKGLDQRFSDGAGLVAALNRFHAEITASELRPAAVRRRINRPMVGLAIVAVLGVIAWGAGLSAVRRARENRARTELIPEIERLSREGKFIAALRLADDARIIIPEDSKLSELIAAATHSVHVLSTPPGADVSYKDYDEPDAEWTALGKTPLQNVSIPRGLLRWKLELPGHRTIVAGMPSVVPNLPVPPLSFTLEPEDEAIDGMTYVPPGFANLAFNGFDPLDVTPIPAFHMGLAEVTNDEYLDFVEKGGYTDASFWKHPFVEDGRTLTFEEAVSRFVDATGRPGPATWELGKFPPGRGHYPVSGVSWFEAAAYAEFRGAQLPTLHQWSRAAFSPIEAAQPVSPKLVPMSNFGGEGPRPGGDLRALSPHGSINMAGNVREWCWNEEESGRRYILGGAWDDPAYMLALPNAASPFDRSPKNGIRCANYSPSIPPSLLAPIPRRVFRFEVRPTLSSDALEFARAQFANPPVPLDVEPVHRDESREDWILEEVSLNTGYDEDRMPVMLFLPRSARPPYQAVVFFPGADFTFQSNRNEIEGMPSFEPVTFLPRSGRALILPVYKGTLERAPIRRIGAPGTIEMGGKDLSRTLDYLATRGDIDMDRLAYMGFSMGSIYAGYYLPFQPRFKTAVLVSGGIAQLQESAMNHLSVSSLLPYIKIPVLMLNGRYDYLFPPQPSQEPFFNLLASPADQKRHVVYEAGHWPLPRHELIRETLDWLDKYLGPVQLTAPAFASASGLP